MTCIRCCRRCSWPPWPTLLFAAQVVALRRWRASGRSRTALWRWLGVTSAALLLLVAATRVVITADDEPATRSAGDVEPNVFLLVDRSPDMAVARPRRPHPNGGGARRHSRR